MNDFTKDPRRKNLRFSTPDQKDTYIKKRFIHTNIETPGVRSNNVTLCDDPAEEFVGEKCFAGSGIVHMEILDPFQQSTCEELNSSSSVQPQRMKYEKKRIVNKKASQMVKSASQGDIKATANQAIIVRALCGGSSESRGMRNHSSSPRAGATRCLEKIKPKPEKDLDFFHLLKQHSLSKILTGSNISNADIRTRGTLYHLINLREARKKVERASRGKIFYQMLSMGNTNESRKRTPQAKGIHEIISYQINMDRCVVTKNSQSDPKVKSLSLKNLNLAQSTNGYKVTHNSNDLTPIPTRKNIEVSKVSDHKYNQAERAAVLIRRMEYSYHMKQNKPTLSSERDELNICLLMEAKVIRIQEWWRKILKRALMKELNALIIQKVFRGYLYRTAFKSVLQQMNLLFPFIASVIYAIEKRIIINSFNNLKKQFAIVAYRNKVCLIQKGFKKYLTKKKEKPRRVERMCRIFRLPNISFSFGKLKSYCQKVSKAITIQSTFRKSLFRRNENLILKLGRHVHPFLFYYLTYPLSEYPHKKKIFTLMVKKFKLILLKKKTVKFEKKLRPSVKLMCGRRHFANFTMKLYQYRVTKLKIRLMTRTLRELLPLFMRSYKRKYYYLWKRCQRLTKIYCRMGMNLFWKIFKFSYWKPFLQGVRIFIKMNPTYKICKGESFKYQPVKIDVIPPQRVEKREEDMDMDMEMDMDMDEVYMNKMERMWDILTCLFRRQLQVEFKKLIARLKFVRLLRQIIESKEKKVKLILHKWIVQIKLACQKVGLVDKAIRIQNFLKNKRKGKNRSGSITFITTLISILTKKYFNILINPVILLNRARFIQIFYRCRRILYPIRRKRIIIRDYVIKKHLQHQQVLNYFFSNWKRFAFLMKIKNSIKVISKFTYKRMKVRHMKIFIRGIKRRFYINNLLYLSKLLAGEG